MTQSKWTAEIVTEWMAKMDEEELRGLIVAALQLMRPGMRVMFWNGHLWEIAEHRETVGHEVTLTLNATRSDKATQR